MARVIQWEAEEYIARKKDMKWYMGLIAVGVVLILFAVWLQQWTFIAVVVVSIAALIMLSVRPARKMKYRLDAKGLTEGEQKYMFSDYQSFGVMKDGDHFAIVLTPVKRFGSRVMVYFPEDKGEEIVDAFGARLPMEEVRMDVVDKIVKFLNI